MSTFGHLIAEDTPPASDLLDYWRQAVAKGDGWLPWGRDRAAALLDHVEGLEGELAAARAHATQLSEIIQWNRAQHDERMAEARAVHAERLEQVGQIFLSRFPSL